MQVNKDDIVFFLIITTGLILLLSGFIITLLFFYQKRKLAYQQTLNTLELDHQTNLLESQVEIQENTFQHISREIHDNISLTLTLAKLQLNTLIENQNSSKTVISSVDLITKSINDLNSLSKALNSDIIKTQGLIVALENEIERIQLVGLFTIALRVKGSPVFMTAEKELIIFRIVQESFNNILKHSNAKIVKITMHYTHSVINIRIIDDGKGFEYPIAENHNGAGLNNITNRAKVLHGQADINSYPGKGTRIHLSIPYEV